MRYVKNTIGFPRISAYNINSEIGKEVRCMREARTTEFKEKITNTFLNTVCAFSNYDGGEIFSGIDDNGNVKGLADVKQACLDIENKINDSIILQPDYTLELQNNDRTIKLTVKSTPTILSPPPPPAIMNNQPGGMGWVGGLARLGGFPLRRFSRRASV